MEVTGNLGQSGFSRIWGQMLVWSRLKGKQEEGREELEIRVIDIILRSL